MDFGYGRTSKKDQNYERQLDALKAYGVHPANIHIEQISGRGKIRPVMDNLLKIMQPGDRLIVTALTRLGRSTRELISIMEELQKKNVDFVSLKENFDTTTASGKMMYGLFAVLAQYEVDLLSERTKDGLEAARRRGRNGGRPKVADTKIRNAIILYDQSKITGKDISIKDICTMTGVSKSTLYRYINENKTKEGE